MAGNSSHRSRRKDGDYENLRRNKDRHSDSDRYDRHRRRERERSRSRHRDDEPRSKKSRSEYKNYRDRSRDRHSKFANDTRVKREPSMEFGRGNIKDEKKEKKPIDKEKPNFGLSGKLTAETNTVFGVVIKYSEPPEARKPNRRWRLYTFKGEKPLPPTNYMHRQSAYLMGRDRKIADFPLDHPSISKQHAVLQYRLVPYTKESGQKGKRIRPYLIDLESANGTFLNNVRLEPKRYYELMERDVLKFGFSTREYVLLHEQSKGDLLDDDVEDNDVEKTEET